MEENDFKIIENKLIYKNKVKVVPLIGQASVDIYKCKMMKHMIYEPIMFDTIMKEHIPYKDIVVKFKEALDGHK